MTLFTTDYSHNDDNKFKPVPEGDYECIIDKASPDATKNGTEYLAVNFRIRDDLDKAMPDTNGKYHKRIIFGQFWKRKDTGKYNQVDIQRLLQNAGIPEGTPIKDWDDFNKKLSSKAIRAHVTVDEDEYNGKTTQRNRVASWNLEPTKFPLQGTDPFGENTGSKDEISDDDLPF